MEIFEQLQKYFKEKGMSQISIAEELGVSKAYINALLSGRQRFGKKQAEIWSKKFGISKSWLLTGEGEMLKEEQAADGSNARLIGKVFGAGQRDEGVVMVDFIPVTAHATFIENIDTISSADFEQYPLIPMGNERNDIDSLRIFEVDGDSMYPTLTAGSLILAKEIPERSWHYAEGVVVAVYNEYVVVKRIASNRLLTDNCLILKSDNESYGEMTVPLSDLRGLYKAKRIISSEIF